MYYSTQYMKERIIKRENTFCSFIKDDNIGYGQIQFFVPKPVPKAFVNVLNFNEGSMICQYSWCYQASITIMIDWKMSRTTKYVTFYA